MRNPRPRTLKRKNRKSRSTSRRSASCIGSVHPLLREAPNRVLRNIVGGVISPLLANIVLHYVLDEWFAKEVRPRLKGEAFLIRYADDFVIGVAREDDARRIMEVLPKRMSKYGLTVHPEKTRVVRFHPADVADSEPADQNSTGPRTFDFLGFTHYWGRSLKGGWVVKRKTAKGRLEASAPLALGLVPGAPAPTDRSPTPDAQTEAARPLRVLWDHR